MDGKDKRERVLRELIQEQAKENDMIVAAIVNGEIKSLGDTIDEGQTPVWVHLSDSIGERVYRRSVLFLAIVAMRELYGAADTELIVRASLNGGLYCDLILPGGVTDGTVTAIEVQMRAIVKENRAIRKRVVSKEEAVRLFKATRQIPKANLLNMLPEEDVVLHTCGEQYDSLYGVMLDKTGELGCFDLKRINNGVLLRMPSGGQGLFLRPPIAQPKFTQTLKESKQWAKILHCEYMPDLNRSIQLGQTGDLIRVSEALHEKKIAEIADRIAAGIKKARLIMIAGPSSSGKTSFAQRLKVQLRVNGLTPVSISLDDYFVNRKETPLTPEGAYDYESLRALNVELFNEHLVALMQGKEVALPRYDFVTGEREDGARPNFSIAPEQPIIVEGIHGLNEELTHAVPRDEKFKIYVSALTQLNIDMHNRIPTTDARFVRRLVRDYQFRASSAIKTLRQWRDVRKGEEKNIFPYQEDADAVFNSALIYELAVLKKYAVPLLSAVAPHEAGYTDAQNILRFLTQFGSIEDESDIPNNSILREFIGKSCFFTSTGDLKE
ncbi:MAG: nucleoside kinase [Selenomonadaceae bacterium]|nr:nucleoside kinase [Selenomonadaceae bacterium]